MAALFGNSLADDRAAVVPDAEPKIEVVEPPVIEAEIVAEIVDSPFLRPSPPVTADQLAAGPFSLALMKKGIPPTDMERVMLELPAEEITQLLAEHQAKRTAIAKHLKDNMVEGVHFGYPPGMRPNIVKHKTTGELLWEVERWQKNKETGKAEKKLVYVKLTEYAPRGCLYKAGGIQVADLMACDIDSGADEAQWAQFRRTDVVVRRVWLTSRFTGKQICAGVGARWVPEKHSTDPFHFAISMAEKGALCAAVLRGFALTELLVQARDMDDPEGGAEYKNEKPVHPDVARVDDPAHAWPRDLHVNELMTRGLFLYWRQAMTSRGEPATVADFCEMAHMVTKIALTDGKPKPNAKYPQFNVILNPESWQRPQLYDVIRYVEGPRPEKLTDEQCAEILKPHIPNPEPKTH